VQACDMGLSDYTTQRQRRFVEKIAERWRGILDFHTETQRGVALRIQINKETLLTGAGEGCPQGHGRYGLPSTAFVCCDRNRLCSHSVL
ncbi:MAG TPA: hypothetical protein VM656_03090, partial [Pyrinomonadaceae bacterium]|nr:hypothetical protein [Pyrinomonadaceae bacterium]